MLHRDTPRYKGIFSETFLSRIRKHHEQQYRSSKNLSGLKLDEHFQRLMARGTGYVDAQRLRDINLNIHFRNKRENITRAFYDLQETIMPDWKKWKERLESVLT